MKNYLPTIDINFRNVKFKLEFNSTKFLRIMPEKFLKLKDIEKLLDEQTSVILSAVDDKISRIDKRISKLEIKVDKRFNQLITILDKFLKRLTNIEDEFEMMKLDINRLKKVIREKLGVDLL